MSGEGLELNLNSPPHNKGECGRRCEDRISELPDDIIVSILSSLPLKNAGATSLASRRWKHLWTYTCNLVFRYHTNTFEMRSGRRALKNIRWVNSALRSHRALYLKQFTISFYLPPVPQIRQPLAEWLHFAFSKRVESLKLEIRNSPFFIDHDIVFPLFNQTKTSTAVVVVCLRELKLRCDAISGEAIELFLCNCPLLERLTVDANLTSDVVVVGGSLKYLGITSENRGKSVKVVSAPNLTRLKCKFNLMLLLFLDENVPDLVEASFCISGPQDIFDRKGPFHLLKELDWSDQYHIISVIASLVHSVYVLHRDSKKHRHGSKALAPRWWEAFGYEKSEEMRDESGSKSESDIFGAIYIHKLTSTSTSTSTGTSNSLAPRCVVAFRGTILSSLSDLKDDLSILGNKLHERPRVEKATEAVRRAVAKFGKDNVWIAGHSLGAAIAFVVGKNMIRNGAVFLKNTYLFNPPFLSLSLHRLLKSPRMEFIYSVVTAAAKAGAALFLQVGDHCTFAALAPWQPYLFVNRYDLICSGYIDYFERRQKMEKAGPWTRESENVAMEHSAIGLASQAMGQESRETMHLLPSANLMKNSNPSKKWWTNHGIRQWWSPHLRIEPKTYTHTPTHDKYCTPSCIMQSQSLRAYLIDT